MTLPSAPPRPRTWTWAWWLATGLVGAGLVIDVVDGAPLKLLTSVLLFVACLLAAVTRTPRASRVRAVIAACLVAMVALVAYRALGPGL